MKKNIVQKILQKHLVSGELILGKEIEINVDQTLTQDSTGTMVYLQLEAMNVEKVKTNISVAYIDHNTLQTGFENADDHEFIKSAADKYGLIFSKAGNGICHQLHLENFGKPGRVLLGSDSHTPTNGGLGMISIGAGGLDVAVAMATGKYMFKMPKVVNIVLEGNLQPWVSSKDVILYLLEKLSVKGAVGKILEYSGGGIKGLSVTDRGTITNMGAELGATTSIFPSDERTYDFLKSQNRSEDWVELKADEGAKYDQIIEVNLNKIEPMIAKPHSPDNVSSIDSVKGLKIDQVAIGSCTNSSYSDLMKVAKILKGKKVHQDVSLSLSPGSSKILNMIAKNGALADIIASGARVLECSCGPCIGMGQAPKTNGISLRTFNRNFYGRSGTKSAGVYLVSPETAAASAIKGVIEDPRNLGKPISIIEPEIIIENKSLFIYPSKIKKYSEVTMGPNIKSFPTKNKIDNNVEGKVLIKLGDDITTDHIMPSSSELLPYRSNIPYLSKYVFSNIEENFWKKCQDGGGIIIGGNNYGQGSSREHAALVPLYLGIKAVIAKSFARIHKANLINAGILPLEFNNVEDYENIGVEDELLILDLDKGLRGNYLVNILNKTKNKEVKVKFNSSERDAEIIKVGGYLNWINKKLEDI